LSYPKKERFTRGIDHLRGMAKNQEKGYEGGKGQGGKKNGKKESTYNGT